jgi:phosphoribosyl-ATP pyrophosphohydrolase / phosphoribosyl-AMP cyclohydrolase / histidinol dehydrogenase
MWNATWTDGRLAVCLLDAGCAKIVTCGTAVAALDAAQIPANRLVAHFVYQSGHEASLQQAISKASEFCTTISIELCHSDDIAESVMMGILQNCCCGSSSSSSSSPTVTTTDPDEGDDAGGASSNSSSHHHHPHSATTSSSSTGDSVLSSLQVVFVFNPKDCLGLLDPDLATLVNDVCRRADNNNRARIALINPTAEQLGMSFAKCLKTDRPDGLYTTVVVTRNGEALGLVYSSMASIVASLQCGRGVYYSRSRHGLWRKGDTSGHYQTLHRIDVDCDGDALRFCVTQRGGTDHVIAFCHLNTLTCWGEPKGLRHLEQALQHRLRHAPPGSYTQRLFSDATLLRDKLVEEAQELAEATEAEHVAEELADLLYFAMTRAVQAGVSLDDAAAVLDKRAHKVTRRQGDSKAFRIAAGQAILEKQQKEQQEQEQQQKTFPNKLES